MSDFSSPPIISDISNILTDTIKYIVDILTNPLIVIGLIVFVIAYLARYVVFGLKNNTDTNMFSRITTSPETGAYSFTHTIVVIVGVLIAIKLLRLFGPSILNKIRQILQWRPSGEILDKAPRIKAAKTAVVPEILLGKQVFNVPGNTYNYQDAKALCSAYGSRLASYKEIESAYENGAEWCNYGWSDGQMALFPTQQKTFDELQKIEGHENDCGRPGVNGGYMENSRLKFGVNCYGYKPQITPEEEHNMATIPHYPKTEKDIAMENRVEYWKSKLSEVIVAPFNYNNWSRI